MLGRYLYQVCILVNINYITVKFVQLIFDFLRMEVEKDK